MRVARLAVPLVAALLAAGDAGAAITMKLNAEISIEHQVAVSLALGVLNSGDEMAREVEPEVISFLVGGAALAAAGVIGLGLAWRRAMCRVPAPEPPPSRPRRKRRRR